MSTPIVWFITGASSGLGAALAIKALNAGHKVIATARDPSKASQTYPEIAKLGGTWIQLDVTAADVEAKLVEATKVYGRLDVVVNNADYSLLGACEDINDTEAHLQLETNFFGPLKVIRSALPTLRAQKSGTIVNISSVAGFDGLPTCSLYAGSKFALEGLSEALSRELTPFNIRVLLINPGTFRTNFLTAFVPNSSGVSDPYQTGPVGDTMKYFETMAGKQRGDAEKAALRMFEVITGTGMGKELGQVMRVPLGTDAVQRLEAKIEQLKGDLEVARGVALSTDFEKE